MADLLNSQPEAVASYSFAELSSSVGYLTFFGFKANDSGDCYLSSNSQIISGPKVTRAADPGTGSYVSWSEMNFDLDIGQWTLIEGTCVVSVPFVLKADGATEYMKMDVVIYHVDSTPTETSLGSDTSNEWSAAIGGADTYVGGSCTVAIPLTKKVFKAGEKFRVAITMKHKGTQSDYQWVGHNPEGSSEDEWLTSASGYSTQLVVMVPVRIQR